MKPNAMMLVQAAALVAALLSSPMPAAAQADDQAAVNAAVTELAIVNASAAYSNLTLPAVINRATVTWTSSNEKLVTAGGEVTRPRDQDAQVILHATITLGAATASKDVPVRVVKAFKKAADEAYLFVHFTFTEEKIHFSLSQGDRPEGVSLLHVASPIGRISRPN